tara:strand:+ start:4257 stop:4520 length:264 start_codon:yes stop_codon:yes gene_type:complete
MAAKSGTTNSCTAELSTRGAGLAPPRENAGQDHEISGVPWIDTARAKSTTRPFNISTARVSSGSAVGNMSADLAGFIRVRRHSRHRH